MNKTNGYTSRIEFRIDPDTKEEIIRYCKEKEVDLSEFSRDALINGLEDRKLVGVVMRSLQNDKFFKVFSQFMASSPKEVKATLEEIFGEEERKLIDRLPEEILSSIKVVSKSGKKYLVSKRSVRR